MNLFHDLKERGLVKDVTDIKIADILEQKRLTLYCGFDPTADCLHIGNLLPLMTLRRFQLAGHRIIALVGGATGMIGDPSGKTQERQLLSNDNIKTNLLGIKASIAKFLDINDPLKTLLVNNADWFGNISYIDFLRDVGKHFTVNHMLAKESVRARLEDREHGISYTEFSYMLMQSYDFYILNKKYDCTLQIGGSDQWGNITAGCELIRRIRAVSDDSSVDVFGITQPLVSKADGSKFGKSETGTIWLDAKKTSPYQFYQYFIRTPDTEAIQFLKYFSFLELDEIKSLEQSLKTEPEKRLAQKKLADEVTALVHGCSEVEKVKKTSNALFGTEIKDLDEQSLLDAFSEAPSTLKSIDTLNSNLMLVDLLAETGLCSSKGLARKEIEAGGIYINNIRTSDPKTALTKSHLIAGNHLVLRKGKKNHHLIKFR